MAFVESSPRSALDDLSALQRVYDAALPLARQLAEQFDGSAEGQPLLQQFQDRISQAASIGLSQPAPGASPAAAAAEALRALRQKVAAQLEELIALCAAIEERVQARRRSLIPAVSHQLRIKHMHSAYSARHLPE